MTKYVVGLIFNVERTEVLLINKNRPDWQKGKLNGVGGKVEEGELPYEAMVRECKEECGLLLYNWLLVGVHTDNINFEVSVFTISTPSLLKAFTRTDEEVEIFKLSDLPVHRLVYPLKELLYTN